MAKPKHLQYNGDAKLIQALVTAANWLLDNTGEASIDYSTTEKAIGTWVDGETLYQKTMSVNVTTTSSWISTGETKGNINKIISNECIDQYGQSFNGYVGFSSLETTANIMLSGIVAGTVINYITIRYTKSS